VYDEKIRYGDLAENGVFDTDMCISNLVLFVAK